MKLITNELYSAIIMSVLVSVLVWIFTPKRADESIKTSSLILKSLIISFGVTYAIFYFIGESGSDDVMDNIIKGEPDF